MRGNRRAPRPRPRPRPGKRERERQRQREAEKRSGSSGCGRPSQAQAQAQEPTSASMWTSTSRASTGQVHDGSLDAAGGTHTAAPAGSDGDGDAEAPATTAGGRSDTNADRIVVSDANMIEGNLVFAAAQRALGASGVDLHLDAHGIGEVVFWLPLDPVPGDTRDLENDDTLHWHILVQWPASLRDAFKEARDLRRTLWSRAEERLGHTLREDLRDASWLEIETLCLEDEEWRAQVSAAALYPGEGGEGTQDYQLAEGEALAAEEAQTQTPTPGGTGSHEDQQQQQQHQH